MSAERIIPGHNVRDVIRTEIKTWCVGGKTQADLAKECGINQSDLSHFLSGKRPLPDGSLANLAIGLGLDPARVLLHWNGDECTEELTRLAAHTDPVPGPKTKGWERARATYQALLARIGDGAAHPASTGRTGTLVDWHTLFPLVVFVGDRREKPAQSPADLLAASASLGDLFYLPSLRLPEQTEIRSDKTCVLAKNDDSLRDMLGDRNLLIIGSPAANLVARVANRGACFSFYVKEEAIDEEPAIRQKLGQIQHFPDDLEQFSEVHAPELRRIIYGFARSGILDPVHFHGARATSTHAHADYGVITLCRHPWSDHRVAVMAAGLHGPATAAALKLLAQPDAFKEHPLGGVFRVHVPINAPWESRYHHLQPKWDTHPYTVRQYEQELDAFSNRYAAELTKQLRFWSPDDVRNLLRVMGGSAGAQTADVTVAPLEARS